MKYFPDNNPYPVLKISEDHTLLYANDAAINMLSNDVRLKLQIGKKIPRFFHSYIDEAVNSGIHRNYEIKIGEDFFSFFLVPVPENECINLYGKNITREKNSELKLKLLAEIFKTGTEAIFITNPKGEISDVNKAFESTTGYTKEEVLGKNPRILKSGKHDALFYQNMWNSLKTKGYWKGEVWDRRKNGEIFPKWSSISAVKDDEGKITHYIAMFSDISLIKKSEESIQRLSYEDPLTGLPNRSLFFDRLRQAIAEADNSNTGLALIFTDIDRFKIINDSLGHRLGDDLIAKVSLRLTSNIKKSDTVARIGGDEFAIILRGIRDNQHPAIVAERVIDAFKKPFLLAGQEIFLSASMGITLYPHDSRLFEEIITYADLAMYTAKDKGGNNYQFYSTEMNAKANEIFDLETKLRKAIEEERFVMYYQPQVDTFTNKITGVEALIRWFHNGQFISPGKFIPLAEETGLIIPLGEWVIRTVIMQIKLWLRADLTPPRVSINISGRQFYQQDLLENITEIILETGIEPNYLEFEITESTVMNDILSNIHTMEKLKELGIHISLDDFGTGYSSLNYLKQFPIDILKIDKSFIDNIPSDEGDKAIAKSIINLAHSLNFKVIAEGVENEDQLAFLAENDCDFIQGYYFFKPMNADDLYKHLA